MNLLVLNVVGIAALASSDVGSPWTSSDVGGRWLASCVLEGMPWTFSDSDSDVSAPRPLALAAPRPLPKMQIPEDPRWARKLHYCMKQKSVAQARPLVVESALSGTLPEYDVFKANYNDY